MEVQTEGVVVSRFEIDAIKNILLIPAVMEYRELGRIEKATRLQSACRDEVPPLLTAIREIEANICSTECAIGGGHVTVRFRDAKPGTSIYNDDEACLVAILSRRRAFNDFNRLKSRNRNLV